MEGSGSATKNNVGHPKHPEEEESSKSNRKAMDRQELEQSKGKARSKNQSGK